METPSITIRKGHTEHTIRVGGREIPGFVIDSSWEGMTKLRNPETGDSVIVDNFDGGDGTPPRVIKISPTLL